MNARTRARRGIALTGALTLGLLMFGVRPAAAAVTCSFNAMTSTVTVTTGAPLDNAVVSVGTGGNAGKILANGMDCTGTVNTTNVIFWDDNAAGITTFTIDLSGGPFAPGATDEPGTTDEIEFDLSSDTGVFGNDSIVILGTSGNDTIIAGDNPMGVPFTFAEDGANLNNDEDADVSIFSNNFRVSGGLGDDILSANGGSGTGAAFDPPAVIQGQDGNDDLYGGDGADNIGGAGVAESGADLITGGAGNDTMVGGNPTSDPLISGGFGGGADTIFYLRETGVADGVDELNLPEVGAGPDTTVGDTFNNTDSVNEFEHAVGSALGDFAIDGNDQANLISGEGGADDNLGGDLGNDLVSGGDGNDTTLGGAGGDDLMFGGAGDDVDVMGGDGNDVVEGNDGNDNLQGGNGADDVFPGLGTDTANGGAGGSDTVDYGDIPGPINGNLETGTVTGASTDTIGAFEGLNGTPAGDTLSGGGTVTTAGAVIKGKQGNDNVVGTNGEDLLLGGQGDDVVNGLGAEDIVRGNDGGDTLQGQADDVLRGQGSNDDLNGGGGDDVLNGGTGTDSCTGGAGVDALRSCEL